MARRDKPAARGSVDQNVAVRLRMQRERLARLEAVWRPTWGPLTMLSWAILTLAVTTHEESRALRPSDYVEACWRFGSKNRVRARLAYLVGRGALRIVVCESDQRERRVVATNRLIEFFNAQRPGLIDDNH